jgi:hypothetical protein
VKTIVVNDNKNVAHNTIVRTLIILLENVLVASSICLIERNNIGSFRYSNTVEIGKKTIIITIHKIIIRYKKAIQ